MVKTYKVLIIGEGAVGKTSVASRYTTGAFKESHLMTIGANFMLKNIVLSNGESVRLSLWDTAGQEKFRQIVETYYKGSSGVILVYDITRRASFEELDYWRSTAEHHVPDAKYVIVGNKLDLADQREVTEDEGRVLATKWNFPYFETSAMLNLNITELFAKISEMMAGISNE